LYYYTENGKELNNDWDVLLPINTRTGRGLVPNLYLPNPAAQGEDYSVDNTSQAIYGQAKYTPELLDSRLGLTLGLRQTWDEKEATILDANPQFNAKKSWKNFNPSITVDFAVTEGIKVYAKVATGYNAGSHPVRSSSQAAFNLTADPEKLIDYEVGLKSDWFDNRLRANLAAYYYDYKDLQVADFQAGSTVVTNAGKATLRGFEMDLTALPLDGLVVDFSYGYMDFDYQEFMLNITNPATGIAQLTDVTSTARAPYSPMHSARLALQYEFAPTPVGVLTASIESTYKDEFHFSPNNFQNVAADAHSLLDARLTLGEIPIPQGDLRVALWGKNLENKEYRGAGIDFGVIGIGGNLYGDPRSYGVDVIYTY
jgi:iron complex outermembrane receptor protein